MAGEFQIPNDKFQIVLRTSGGELEFGILLGICYLGFGIFRLWCIENLNSPLFHGTIVSLLTTLGAGYGSEMLLNG
jgi:hypothetical protein